MEYIEAYLNLSPPEKTTFCMNLSAPKSFWSLEYFNISFQLDLVSFGYSIKSNHPGPWMEFHVFQSSNRSRVSNSAVISIQWWMKHLNLIFQSDIPFIHLMTMIYIYIYIEIKYQFWYILFPHHWFLQKTTLFFGMIETMPWEILENGTVSQKTSGNVNPPRVWWSSAPQNSPATKMDLGTMMWTAIPLKKEQKSSTDWSNCWKMPKKDSNLRISQHTSMNWTNKEFPNHRIANVSLAQIWTNTIGSMLKSSFCWASTPKKVLDCKTSSKRVQSQELCWLKRGCSIRSWFLPNFILHQASVVSSVFHQDDMINSKSASQFLSELSWVVMEDSLVRCRDVKVPILATVAL